VVVHLAYCALLLGAACSVSAALALLFLVNGLLQYEEMAWQTHLLAGGAMLAGGFCLYALGVMGAGDVKLLAVTSLWVGLPVLAFYLLTVVLAGLATALVLLTMRRLTPARLIRRHRWVPASFLPSNRVPYGVAIALSAILAAGKLPSAICLF
jgi:prepilin peptidase CpaA